MAAPLTSMRVADLTHVMAGPVCTLFLADLGADVIKVERVPEGDDSRRMVPPFVGDQAAGYLMLNRHKRGIALDLKKPAGKQVLSRLIAESDVVVENYRKGTMEKLGFGFDTLRAKHPALITCSISGFGRTGPYSELGGYDLMAQAMSGIMSFTGEAAGRPPVKAGAPICDITAGVLAALGIVAAWAHRQRTGEGQNVDTSLFEAGIMHGYWQSAIAFATGSAPGPMGSAHPLDAPYQAFLASDAWLVVGAANQANWLRLLNAIQRPDLQDDARFASNAARVVNLAALVDVLQPIFRAHSRADWLQRLQAAGVPAAPVMDVREMHDDPQAKARGMVVSVAHPRLGSVQTLGCPIKLGRNGAGLGEAAPALGQHTRTVLHELGYGGEAINDMIAEGAVMEAVETLPA
jgi:crotonobetainyl-CoA:carnitine CoA-transferase CaiB-like acyl-CoA transferase